MRWPEVNRDDSTVGSVVDRHHDKVARIFLPLHTPWGPASWSAIATSSGMELTAETSLAELDAASDVELQSAYGNVDETIIEDLVRVLAPHTIDGKLRAVVWGVYNDDPPGDTSEPIPERDGATRWHDGGHELTSVALDDLDEFSRQSRRRFPVALFPDDVAWVIGAAGYSDSLLISGSEALMTDLASTRLEWLPTRRGAPLPVEYLA